MVFKKILFILILPFFLYAQWTDPRPKSIQLWHLNTSFFDSLGNVVRDSVAALSADGVTIVNDGTLKQKVFADTTSLPTVTAGTRIIIEKLSANNPNGGGIFIGDTSANTANGATVFAASGGYWVRETYYLREYVSVTDAGAIPSDQTDDLAAFRIARDIANAVGIPLILPPDTFNLSDTFVDSNFVQGKGFKILGSGKNVTIIKATTDINPFDINEAKGTGGSYGVNDFQIADLTIIGVGASTSTEAGISLDTCSVASVERVAVTGFKYGIKLKQGNNIGVRQCSFNSNWVGGWFDTGTNGCLFSENTFANNDSLGFYVGDGKANRITGGEFGSQPIGVYVGTSGDVTLQDINMENHSVTPIYMFGGANVDLFGCSLLRGSGGSSPDAIGTIIQGTGHLTVFHTTFRNFNRDSVENDIWLRNSGARVRVFTAARNNDDISTLAYIPRIYDETAGDHYYQNQYNIRRTGGVEAADSLLRGMLTWEMGTSGNEDVLWMHRRLNDTTYANTRLSDGTEWYVTTNGANFARQNRTTMMAGKKFFTRASGTDTTEMFMVLPFIPEAIFSVVASAEYNGVNRRPYAYYRTTNEDTLFYVVVHDSASSGLTTFNAYLHTFVVVQKPFGAY